MTKWEPLELESGILSKLSKRKENEVKQESDKKQLDSFERLHIWSLKNKQNTFNHSY